MPSVNQTNSINMKLEYLMARAQDFEPTVGAGDVVRIVRELSATLNDRHTETLHIINDIGAPVQTGKE